MATLTAPAAIPARPATQLPGRRYDHFFFSITAALMLVTVFIGFSRTYYLAGVFRAPLASRILHMHGAAFSLWMLLLITQTSLVAVGRTDIHKRLGLAGFALGCLMIVLGVLAGTDSLVRHMREPVVSGPSRDPRAFYIVPLTAILLFGVFLYFAFRNRLDSVAHKRYLFIATTAMLDAAVARIPLPASFRNMVAIDLLTFTFVLLLIAYDYWSTRKIHRVTRWAGATLLVIEMIRGPIASTAAWHSFADWVIAHVR